MSQGTSSCLHALNLIFSTITMAGTKSTNLPPCSYYLRGTCTRGETCQFPHIRSVDPLNSPDRPTAFPKAPCKFFLSGHCRNGDQCEFKHPTTNQSNDLGSQRARTSTSRVYYPGSRVDVSRSPDDASWRSGVRGPANMVPLVFGRCKFFAKGLCTKGTACPFSHLLEPGLGGVGATEVGYCGVTFC